MNQRNIVSKVVKHDLCIGCVLCAGVCPSDNLTMMWNKYDEYNPVEEGHCLENCSLCLRVCPFMDGNDNEDTLGQKFFGDIPDINHTKETGYYLQCYAGYSCNREIGASGGITSFVLERLLIDKVEPMLHRKIRYLSLSEDELEKYKAALKLEEAIELWSSGGGE